MKPRCIYFAILAMLLAAARLMAEEPTNSPAAATAAQPTNGLVKLDFASFQLISQHNIFDPNRRPRGSTYTPIILPTARIDSFSLRGTLSLDGQSAAVFVGSSSQYSKTATSADTIAGYKIAEIAFDHVKLAASSNQTINLPVGAGMKRRDNGPWSLVENPEPSSDSSASTASDKPAATSSASSVVDDVIKRLMQKREQEK